MKYGFTYLGSVAVRKEPTSLSEQVTQLLFGESVEVLDVHEGKNRISDSWLYIRNISDNYTGWIDKRNVILIDKPIVSDKGYIVSSPIAKMKTGTDIITIPMASVLPGKIFSVNDIQFSLFDGNVIPQNKCNPLLIKAVALLYLNTPYQWGGKTIFGLDCSGFVQNVFSFAGIKLPRDASQQSECGRHITFDEIKANDLMFFCNDSQKVNHVGIYLGEGKIIHCSGKVRIDDVSEEGIYVFNPHKEYSHRLCNIMRLTD